MSNRHAFRSLLPGEIQLLSKMLAHTFPGHRELQSQLPNITARVVSPNGSLEFNVSTGSRASVIDNAPDQMEVEDRDGVPIHCFVHVKDGYLFELNVTRIDGELILAFPDATAGRVLPSLGGYYAPNNTLVPTYLPVGYKYVGGSRLPTDPQGNSDWTSILIRNTSPDNDSNYLELQQTRTNTRTRVSSDNQVTIRGSIGNSTITNGIVRILWFEDQYEFEMKGTLALPEMMRIAESLRKIRFQDN